MEGVTTMKELKKLEIIRRLEERRLDTMKIQAKALGQSSNANLKQQ